MVKEGFILPASLHGREGIEIGMTEILAERMPLKSVGKNEGPRIRVSLERDPEKFRGLTLVPFGGAENPAHGRDRGLVPVDPGPDNHPIGGGPAEELIDQFESTLGRTVDSGEVLHMMEADIGLEEREAVADLSRLDCHIRHSEDLPQVRGREP
jgi:hypothetical protein